MPVRIRNGLPAMHEPLEQAIRASLESFQGDLEVVITPAVDAQHAEVLLLEGGQRCGAYFADLQQAPEVLGRHVRRSLRRRGRG